MCLGFDLLHCDLQNNWNSSLPYAARDKLTPEQIQRFSSHESSDGPLSFCQVLLNSVTVEYFFRILQCTKQIIVNFIAVAMRLTLQPEALGHGLGYGYEWLLFSMPTRPSDSPSDSMMPPGRAWATDSILPRAMARNKKFRLRRSHSATRSQSRLLPPGQIHGHGFCQR